MPLIILEKEIDWRETMDKVTIIISLVSRIGVKPSILITSKYLKISSPPHLWECFLVAAIDPDSSFVRIGNGTVTFELRKTVAELWNKLSDDRAGIESYRKQQRHEAFEENKKYLETKLEEKSAKQQEIHKTSVRKQMELDELERKLVQKEKKLENERVAADLKRQKEQLKANMIAQKRKNMMKKLQELPPSRKTGHITVSFTKRVFPTAARESQEAEENEWLEKQFAASKSLNLDCADLLPEEKNPEWLKSKAESMFKRGDFRSAINAYSLAIRMCPNLYSLYSGRSACHLNLHNLHKAIEDSSKALELLVPPVPSNADARKQAHKIRGEAFHQLQLYAEGLMDYEAALKIDPKDEDLMRNVSKAKAYIENGSPNSES